MSRLRLVLPALAVAACCAPAVARAQCAFSVGPTPMTFGAYSPANATDLDATSTFQFECPNNAYRATAMLSAGAGTFTQRQMVSGGERLNYNLFVDAARTTIWGDGTPPSQTRANLRRRTTYTIYGRIPLGQWVPAGNYSDTITLTILF